MSRLNLLFIFCVYQVVESGTAINGSQNTFQFLDDSRMACEKDWYSFNGKCYKVGGLQYSKLPWQKAADYCREDGGSLVVIQNKETQNFVRLIVLELKMNVWIGLHDKAMESHYEWADGSAVSYTNWHPGEPSGRKLQNEDCVEMTFLPNTGESGQWNDLSCDSHLPFICQKDIPTTLTPTIIGSVCPSKPDGWRDLGGDMCYYFEFEKMLSWHEANFDCMFRGGALASIHSEEESNAVHEFVIYTKGLLYFGLHRRFHGGKDFAWADKSELDWLNWNPGEPNFEMENCAELMTSNMKWNDIACVDKKGYICSIKKIAPATNATIATEIFQGEGSCADDIWIAASVLKASWQTNYVQFFKMEDNSSASSDSDNALLSPKNRSRIGCNAATQTPEMSRHEIVITDNGRKSSAPETNGKSSIMVYKLDAQKPLSELEQEAKTLAIPDVVVEYIKDSYHRQEDNSENGITNPAFEPQDLIIVRTPSCVSLRDDIVEDSAASPIGKDNQKMYYSLPRSKKPGEDNSNAHSQPSTPKLMPKLLSAADPSLSVSMSSLGYPRSVPPSPNFGYRPLESETSAVYTIIAPVKYMGTAEKEQELRLLAELQAQLEKDKAKNRKFEFMPAPIEVERKRQRLQCVTDTCSTLFLIPGIFIAIVTPISLIPMFILPLTYYIPLILIFIFSGCVAVVSLALSGLTGNVVWHYDANKNRLRPRFHCGRGPLLHFWGNGFYPSKEDKQPLQDDKVV
ncbi:uncharacterized protein LOC129216754 [Uloborus diversus]|uniref:uncharacterized protein LOC129216754 n=1 Tax=Uloborus diversus TaxID=327109 RepID=UPI00240A4597|nr:uncharacterized protein LOC129216754 [Uloborus diversus]